VNYHRWWFVSFSTGGHLSQEHLISLLHSVDEFCNVKYTAQKSGRTVQFYHDCLKEAAVYLDSLGILQVTDIKSTHIHQFLEHLQESGIPPGGWHAYFETDLAMQSGA
jgi:site-specific recombinase XerD